MNISDSVAQLFDKDTSAGFENLQRLEKLAEESDVLYGYFEQFLEMIKSNKYAIRTRGFRLLGKLAKWDSEGKFEKNITVILANLDDEKPTAVRQKLMALGEIAKYLPGLRDEIKRAVESLDYSKFRDSMRPLIEKDVREVLAQSMS